MTNLQNSVLCALSDNNCNVSDALDSCGVSLEEFEGFFQSSNFEKQYKAVQQKADDVSRRQLDELCAKGDRVAIIEKNKFLRQSDDANESKRVRKYTMKSLMELCDTNTGALKRFCEIFKCSKNTADDYFKAATIEFDIKTPAARVKNERARNGRQLHNLFDSGQLPRIEAMRKLVSKCFLMVETAEYPSEQKGGMEIILKIMEYIDDYETKQKAEAEQDKIPRILKLKAMLYTSSDERIKQVEEEMKAYDEESTQRYITSLSN